MERVFGERGFPFRVSMEVSSNETIKQAVMANMGISFISSHTVGLELAAGKLVILDVVGLPIVRDWYVIHCVTRPWPRFPPRSARSCSSKARESFRKRWGDLPARVRRA